MSKEILNFAYGTNELPELRPWQEKWKLTADEADFYSITGFQGLPVLQKSISKRFETRGVKGGISSRQIMVTSGGTEALFTSLLWIRSIKGTVILQHPSWGYFSDTLQLLDIPFRYSRATSAEGLRSELLEMDIRGPYLFLLTHPSNPFSFVFPEDYLRVLSDWVREDEHHYVLSDEIYDWYVTEEDGFISWATLHGLDQSIIVHGYSKATGLAGFRIGYLVADTRIYKELFPFHYSSSYGAVLFSQYMALEAQADEGKVRTVLQKALDHRWALLEEIWENSSLLELRPRKPGMYAYIDVHGPVEEQKKFIARLKSEGDVWVNPGWNFGVSKGGFRLNLCRPVDTLQTGIDRILSQANQYFSK